MNNELNKIMISLKKRDEILKENGSIRSYNHHFNIIRKCVKKIIAEHKESSLLPLLDSENISYRRDMAGFLYNCYREKCMVVLHEIASMSVENGLPFYYINLSISAKMALEEGIPLDFP